MSADLATLCEAYVEGRIDIDGPIADVLKTAEGLVRELGAPEKGKLLALLRNMHSKKHDAASIEHHYDVSNEFYALWFDPNMIYSCAYYRTGDEDLGRADPLGGQALRRRSHLQCVIPLRSASVPRASPRYAAADPAGRGGSCASAPGCTSRTADRCAAPVPWRVSRARSTRPTRAHPSAQRR